ncbi:hypothetical protein MMYC01_205690 [Madurella mycetomatis]|uniref:Initiation-specific alpha-1,6-mannosyltransferase n=1 Tax=Madurella mycetomatis TaxID=100816 RepID=A0A175W512_9PEZI|nr:hypothetical protein MMYC01_205690 [Madurella mycetomatis]
MGQQLHSELDNNTDYAVEFKTDSSVDRYVQKKLGAVYPELVEFILASLICISVLTPAGHYERYDRTPDILRCFFLFVEGGICSDFDISCETPISEWVLPHCERDVSFEMPALPRVDDATSPGRFTQGILKSMCKAFGTTLCSI